MTKIFLINFLKKYKLRLNFLFAYYCINIFFFNTKKRIKFISYKKSEIGSATWVDGFLRRVQNEKYRKYTYICMISGSHDANSFFEDLRKKQFKKYNITSIENKLLIKFLSGIFLYKNKYVSELMHMLDYAEFCDLKKIDWLGQDYNFLEKKLKTKLGMSMDDWFVCFFSRDNNYDKINRPQMVEAFKSRNADINSFIPAMKYVTSKGGFAIRIGTTANKKLITSNNNKIIDYPFINNRNEMDDFLLLYFCKYCVGTPSGIIDTASLNNKPIALVNNNEYLYDQQFNKSLFIPKLLLKNNNKYLTRKEYMKMIGKNTSLARLNNLINRFDLKYIDNSQNDILQLTEMMLKILNGIGNEYNDLRFSNYCSENGLEIFNLFAQKYKI